MLSDHDRVTFLIMVQDVCVNVAILLENCLFRYGKQFGGTTNIRMELTDQQLMNNYNLSPEDAICLGFIVFYKGLQQKKVISNLLSFFQTEPDEEKIIAKQFFQNKKKNKQLNYCYYINAAIMQNFNF